MEERALILGKRIQQLAEVGSSIEIELRGKKDAATITGKVVFVGDDYIEFVREVKRELTQEGDDETIITIINLTIIMPINDIQVCTVLKEGATVRQVSTKESKNHE